MGWADAAYATCVGDAAVDGCAEPVEPADPGEPDPVGRLLAAGERPGVPREPDDDSPDEPVEDLAEEPAEEPADDGAEDPPAGPERFAEGSPVPGADEAPPPGPPVPPVGDGGDDGDDDGGGAGAAEWLGDGTLAARHRKAGGLAVGELSTNRQPSQVPAAGV